MAKDVDANTMYQILNGIFGRELNENYRTNTKSNLAGTVADIGNYLDARKNDKRNEARKDLYYNNMSGGGNGNRDTVSVLNGYRASGGIGVDEDGMFRIDGRGNKVYDTQQSGGIGADANGVYGVGGVTPQTNAPTFSGGNNFDWGKASPVPKENSAMDYWNNSRPNNVMFQGQQSSGGDTLGKVLTTSGLDILTGKDGGTFSSVLNGFGGLLGGSGSNPYQPSNSSNNSAQGIGGQNNVSANDLSRYLGDEYNRGRWIQDDYEQRGVNDPVISMLRYDSMIAPLVQRAREDRVKDLFMRSNNPNLSDEERMNAKLQLAGELQDPEFIDKMEYNKWKRQKEKDEWDLDRISKGIRNKAAEQAIEDKKNNKQIQLNAQKLSALFGDGKIYEMPLNETMEDTGLQKTDKEVVSGLNLLNTYSRKFFNTDLSANGGWRSEEHQRRLYEEQGKKPFMDSLHLKGRAVDIDVSKLSDAQREELMGFAEKLGFSTDYHDIGNGIHLHVELGEGRHLTDASVLMSNAGLKPSKTTKDTKQTGAKYDSQKLADMINSTYTEGKKHASDAERGQIGDYMSTMVGRFVNPNKAPKDSYMEAAEGLYDYYHNVAGANKGWSLNSEEFSHLVARAVHKYYIDNFGVDIPIQYIDRPLFAKFDTQSKDKIEDAKKAEEANKGKPKTIEEEAKQVLVGNGQSATSQQPQGEKPKVGSKFANDLNKPITFNGIMEGIRANPTQYTDPNLTWHW